MWKVYFSSLLFCDVPRHSSICEHEVYFRSSWQVNITFPSNRSPCNSVAHSSAFIPPVDSYKTLENAFKKQPSASDECVCVFTRVFLRCVWETLYYWIKRERALKTTFITLSIYQRMTNSRASFQHFFDLNYFISYCADKTFNGSVRATASLSE